MIVLHIIIFIILDFFLVYRYSNSINGKFCKANNTAYQQVNLMPYKQKLRTRNKWPMEKF